MHNTGKNGNRLCRKTRFPAKTATLLSSSTSVALRVLRVLRGKISYSGKNGNRHLQPSSVPLRVLCALCGEIRPYGCVGGGFSRVIAPGAIPPGALSSVGDVPCQWERIA